jgi:antitoxin ChpS
LWIEAEGVILKYNFNPIPYRHPVFTTRLRKVGGSIMLAVPPAFLDQLHLQADATVGLAVEHDRLIVAPRPRPRYTLAELLAASDYSPPQTPGEREWVDAPAVGREIL